MSSDLKSCWSLEGRVYLVTGGTKGIGFATARSLLAHGANGVLICARSKNDCTNAITQLKLEFPATHLQIIACVCDVSTSEGRQTLLEATRNAFGGVLHGLINNVGRNVRKDISEQTSEEYNSMMKTNVDSAYFLCQLFQELLTHTSQSMNLERTGMASCVVNVASAAGVQSSGTGAVYGMSKAAMIHLTKILACEWAKLNIRVNAVAPWMTMTPMLEEAVKANPTQLDKAHEWTPMHRLASAEEIAHPIVFLLMPSSSYVTGQCLGIDGGLTAQGFDGPCATSPVDS